MARVAMSFKSASQDRLINVIWAGSSLAALLLVWSVSAGALDSRFFPAPLTVLAALLVEWRSGDLFFHLSATLARVLVSFTLAMIIGSVIGIALGQYKKADRFFDSWLILMLNLPALVVMVLCYIWFGLTDFAAILAVIINKVPNVAALCAKAHGRLIAN